MTVVPLGPGMRRTLGGKLSVSGTLKDFETRLANHDFYRSNSCYLVNLRHVIGVEDQDCVMSDGERLRVSRPRKKAFLTALADYMGATGPLGGRAAASPPTVADMPTGPDA